MNNWSNSIRQLLPMVSKRTSTKSGDSTADLSQVIAHVFQGKASVDESELGCLFKRIGWLGPNQPTCKFNSITTSYAARA